VSPGLDRVRDAARQRKKEKFTALLHHVTVDLLKDAFLALKRRAAPGVDGVTWQDYEEALEGNLQDLHARVQRGAYRALPVRRRFIPKADGKQRPLGVTALEDKIVQRAVVTVLNAIYEEDFLGFSYGFHGMTGGSPSNTQGGSPVRESRTLGSVRGALSNGRPYRDRAPQRSTSASPVPAIWWLATAMTSLPRPSLSF